MVEAAQRSWGNSPTPMDVVCVRDNQGRVWRLSSDGFWRHDPLGFGRDWSDLLHYYGPVHEVR